LPGRAQKSGPDAPIDSFMLVEPSSHGRHFERHECRSRRLAQSPRCPRLC
jgi:hypothetical protein